MASIGALSPARARTRTVGSSSVVTVGPGSPDLDQLPSLPLRGGGEAGVEADDLQ